MKSTRCERCYHKIICDSNNRSFTAFFDKCKNFKDKIQIIETDNNRPDEEINTMLEMKEKSDANEIRFKNEKGTMIAYIFENDDGYQGIRTEFIANDDKGHTPGRPKTSLEFTPNGEIQAVVYGKSSEDPLEEFSEQEIM